MIDIQPGPRTERRPPESELGFGTVFTDHMFLMEHDRERGWHGARVVPRAPLALDPAANVFHYGQALFDGLKAFRWADGSVRLFRPQLHCARMAEGARRLCMPSFDPELLLEAIKTLIRVDREWVPASPGTALYVRPVIIGTGAAIGVRPAARTLLFIILSPVAPYWGPSLETVRIWVEERRVRAARGGLGAVKAAGNYAASLLSAEEARTRGYDQVLWLDAQRHRALEEVGMMNVFVRLGEEVATPPLEGSFLAGVTRDATLRLLSRWGVPAAERELTIDELTQAAERGTLAEVFGTGTAALISPVRELGYRDRVIRVGDGRPGAIAQRLYRALGGIQQGLEEDVEGWMELACA